VLDLLVDAARDEHLPRLGNTLETRGNVDAIAIDIIVLDDDIAEIDADPVLDSLVARQGRVTSRHVLLDDDAATHGFDRTVEDRKETVAGRLDEPPVVFGNAGLNQIALDSLHARMRALLVELHEAAVTGDVTGDDRSKAPWRHRARRHILIPSGINIANFFAHESRYATGGRPIPVQSRAKVMSKKSH
jgi:hypothetical protein